jgi:hypothetical protein
VRANENGIPFLKCTITRTFNFYLLSLRQRQLESGTNPRFPSWFKNRGSLPGISFGFPKTRELYTHMSRFKEVFFSGADLDLCEVESSIGACWVPQTLADEEGVGVPRSLLFFARGGCMDRSRRRFSYPLSWMAACKGYSATPRFRSIASDLLASRHAKSKCQPRM